MQARVDGKVALVTGATQGIGLAVAETLAASGAGGLIITGRDVDRGAAAAADVSRLGAPTDFVAADLADDAAPQQLVAACLARFGRIDALVNVAALTDRAAVVDGSPEDWSRLFAVNARAPFFLMQGAIAAMRARGEGGSIVNILSTNVHCGQPDLAVYTATKAALAAITKNTANAHRFDRIRINGINVGWALTPGEDAMQSQTLGNGPDWAARAAASLPFGRLLMPQEVANLAVFLVSDASGPMTGSLIDQEQWVPGSRA